MIQEPLVSFHKAHRTSRVEKDPWNCGQGRQYFQTRSKSNQRQVFVSNREMQNANAGRDRMAHA